MDTLPLELFVAILGWVDTQTLLLVVPTVSRRWKAICRGTVIDLDLREFRWYPEKELTRFRGF